MRTLWCGTAVGIDRLSSNTSTPTVILAMVVAERDITALDGARRPQGTDTMTDQKTVHDVTYDLLRSLGLTTVFGNPGSTEETFLKNFPDDFTYVLGIAGSIGAGHGRRVRAVHWQAGAGQRAYRCGNR